MVALEGDELESWRRMANSSLLTTLLSNYCPNWLIYKQNQRKKSILNWLLQRKLTLTGIHPLFTLNHPMQTLFLVFKGNYLPLGVSKIQLSLKLIDSNNYQLTRCSVERVVQGLEPKRVTNIRTYQASWNQRKWNTCGSFTESSWRQGLLHEKFYTKKFCMKNPMKIFMNWKY